MISCLFCCGIFSNNNLFAAKKDSLEKKFDYFRIGLDLSKIVVSPLAENFNAYEFTFDTHYKKDIYFVTDFGFGNSFVTNQNMEFKSKNVFARFGLDKTFFSQEFKGDMDNAFIGLRYGFGIVNRGEATYFIKDTVWGNTSGAIAPSNFVAHWLELGGGFRIEIVKNIFLGWNIRAKTFINPKKFEELPPAYLAGYGRSEKNTAFGYNFYLLAGFGKKR